MKWLPAFISLNHHWLNDQGEMISDLCSSIENTKFAEMLHVGWKENFYLDQSL